MFDLNKFKKQYELGLTPNALKELVLNHPEIEVGIKMYCSKEGDIRLVMSANEALELSYELELYELKKGHFREVWII